MQVVLGHSEDVDTEAALAEVLATVQAGLVPEVGKPQAALLFVTFAYDRTLTVERVRQVFPDLPLMGCTVGAISSSVRGYHVDSLALVVICGDAVSATIGVARELSLDPRGVAETAAAALKESLKIHGDPPQLCISFSESLTVSGADVLDGLLQATGGSTPVLGGTSTDDLSFERNFQFFGDEVLSDSAPYLLLSGDLSAAWCADCGWYPVGIAGEVTDVEGPVVRRVGNESALAFYQRYLGEQLNPSVDNPLAVYDTHEPNGAFYLRAPKSVDERSGAVTFLGPVPLGAQVRVTETCREDIVGAARRAVERAREGVAQKPTAALFFSCVGRKNHLGTRTHLELEVLREATGSDCPTLGVYTYGEFGSVTPQGQSRFLNHSIVALLLGSA